MKILTVLAFAGTCSQVIDIEGCGKREVKYPCPEVSPTPEISPSPSPTSSPIPSPKISPTPNPSPSPSPQSSPSPSPVLPSSSPSPLLSPSPSPFKCTVDFEKKNNCKCCDLNLAYAQERGYWSCPESYPGTSSEPYDPNLGGGLCHNNGDGKFRIDRECNKWSVLANGNFLVAKRDSGWDHLYCEDVIKPSPSPIPSSIPSPTPEISPTPHPPSGKLTPAGNYPLPQNWQSGSTCNADYAKGIPTSFGAQYLSTVPIKPGDRYIGIRINVSATPHVNKPYCEQSCYDEEGTYALSNCRNTCEQLKGCQDQDGTPIYMTLPGKFENEICDEQSHNKWNCHHKPEIGQTGPTTFIPYPRGAQPGSEEAKKFCGGSHPKRPGFINCAGVTVEVK